MPLIEIFDGTEHVMFGRAIVSSFAEIAKYQRIRVTPGIGIIDLAGYAAVKESEETAQNRARGQVHQSELLAGVLNHPKRTAKAKNIFVLTEKDLYGDGLNWCFGGVIPDGNGGRHVVLSTYRLQDLDTLAHVATHELGHLFGAATQGRTNTEMNLGSHCTNDCVMQQKITIPDMISQARKLARRQDKFCYQCQTELRLYR